MQVTVDANEGLKRTLTVVVDAGEVETKVAARLAEIGRTVKIPGFRPGKVPPRFLRQRFGEAVRGEVLEGLVQESAQAALDDQGLRPAMQPKVDVKAYDEGKDLEFTLDLEVIPDFEVPDFKAITLTKPVAPVSDEAVDEALQSLAQSRTHYHDVHDPRPAKEGDAVVIDFEGSIDGVPFDGGKAEDATVEIGAGRFIPGFEEQLVGLNVGDETTITVTFPEDYGQESLAGKEAQFAIKAKGLKESHTPEVSEDFAKSLGLDGLDALRDMARGELANEHESASRQKLKRALLDVLAEKVDFDCPPGMLEMEFEQIWRQVQSAKEQDQLDEDDKAKSEAQLEADYRAIAARRVRLGLLLAEVGRTNKVSVGNDDLRRAMLAEARRFPGQEAQVFEFYQKNPQALESLRAPLFEDKVVDFILELITAEEQEVSREELFRDPDEPAEEAKPAAKKPAAKPAAKKAAAKKAPAKKAEAEGDGEAAAESATKKPAAKKAPAKAATAKATAAKKPAAKKAPAKNPATQKAADGDG